MRLPAPFADFSGEDVVERHMERLGREPLLQTIRDAAQHKSSDLDNVLKEYGEAPRRGSSRYVFGALWMNRTAAQ